MKPLTILIALAASVAGQADQSTQLPTDRSKPPARSAGSQNTAPRGTRPTPAPVDFGRPKGTRIAGTRGATCAHLTSEPLTVVLLSAPPGKELTAVAAPDLLAYFSGPINTECDITLTLSCDPADQGAGKNCPEPRHVQAALPIHRGGLQRLRVADLPGAFRLQPGITYRWYLSIGREWEPRSADIVVGDWIERTTQQAGQEPFYDLLADLHKQCPQAFASEVERIALMNVLGSLQEDFSQWWQWTRTFCEDRR